MSEEKDKTQLTRITKQWAASLTGFRHVSQSEAESLAEMLTPMITAAEHQGAERQRERDARLVESYHENSSTNDYSIAAAIRSNQ